MIITGETQTSKEHSKKLLKSLDKYYRNKNKPGREPFPKARAWNPVEDTRLQPTDSKEVCQVGFPGPKRLRWGPQRELRSCHKQHLHGEGHGKQPMEQAATQERWGAGAGDCNVRVSGHGEVATNLGLGLWAQQDSVHSGPSPGAKNHWMSSDLRPLMVM